MKSHAVLFCICLAAASAAKAQDITFPSEEECLSNFKELRSTASVQQFSELADIAYKGVGHSVLRYLVGKDSVITDLRKTFGETALSRALDATKNKLDSDQISYWSGYIRYQDALATRQKDEFLSDNPGLRGSAYRYSLCGLVAVYKDQDVDSSMYARMTKSSFRSGRFGYFDVSVKSCIVASTVGTKYQISEPEKWDGSQFVVVDARFRNMDKEGRLPFEGSLIIKAPNGDEFKYDNSETIMAKGYGIYFKSVNPLVTMPTKIVYRIPSDIEGEILWEPGRNAEGKRLWCTFVAADDQ